MKKIISVLLFINLAYFLAPKYAFAEVKELIIESDNTWAATKTFQTNWMNNSFDDSGWGYSMAPSKGRCSLSKSLNMNFADPMWAANPKDKETVYFRKKFYVNGVLQEALLTTGFDDDGEIYVNGKLVRVDTNKKVNAEPSVDDILQYLEPGENVIALKVVDVQGGCQWAQVLMKLEILYEQRFQLDVPMFKQTDPRWADNVYAGGLADKLDCGMTIADCGCPVSSLAMIMNYFGVTKDPQGNPTNPNTINRYFSRNMQCGKRGCTSLGYAFGSVIWPAAAWYSKESNDQFKTQKIEWEGMAPFSAESLTNSIYQAKPAILKAKDRSHWVVVDGTLDNTFTIKDPYFDINRLDNVKYGGVGERMARYKKTNSDFSALYIVVAGDVQFFVNNSVGEKTGIDTATQTLVQNIPKSSYFFEHSGDLSQEDNPSVTPEKSEEKVHTFSLIAPQKDLYTLTVVPDGKEYSVAVYASSKEAEVKQQILESENYENDQYFLAYDPEDMGSFKVVNEPKSVEPTILPSSSPTPTSTVPPKISTSCKIVPPIITTQIVEQNTNHIGIYEYFKYKNTKKATQKQNGYGKCRELKVIDR